MREFYSKILGQRFTSKSGTNIFSKIRRAAREKETFFRFPGYYEFSNNTKIISGNMVLENIPAELKKCGAKTPYLIFQQELVEKGVIKLFLKALTLAGIDNKHVLLCSRNVAPEYEQQAMSEFMASQCDAIIAIGGGSSFILGKAMRDAVLLNHEVRGQVPFITVPAVNSGHEITGNPDIIVLDSRLTRDIPPDMTIMSAMDTLYHAIETYTGRNKNPLSDAFAYSAVSLVGNNLNKALKSGKDRLARLALSNASLLSTIAWGDEGKGLCHVLARILEEKYGIAHEEAIGILLPHYLELNMTRLGMYYGELLLPLTGAEIFADTLPYERGRKFVQVIKNIIADGHKKYGAYVSLSEIGVKRADFDEIIEMCKKIYESSDRTGMTEEETKNILNFAF